MNGVVSTLEALGYTLAGRIEKMEAITRQQARKARA
jgi:hypothetical protein